MAQITGELDISSHLAALHNVIVPDTFRPLHLRYLQYNPQEDIFRLLLDKGDTKNLNDSLLEDTSKTLLKYFLICLSLPNDSFWVNLRPDSPDNITDPYLAQTDIGKIMLESDLQLKKDTANATPPQTLEGKDYWNKLYQKAGELFGNENITIPTLTRPWIVPDEIIIRETTDSAYIYKATLKVMLEQDYLKDSVTYSFKDPRLKALNEYSSQLIRELIIPKLTKEVNSSKRYAALRQVYYSLIMAQWFKARNIGKNNVYSRLIDRRDLTNLNSKQTWSKTTYFEAYQKSFKDGEYNIKEPAYTPFGQTIRSYFSGGISMGGPEVSDAKDKGARVPARQTIPVTQRVQHSYEVAITLSLAGILCTGPGCGNAKQEASPVNTQQKTQKAEQTVEPASEQPIEQPARPIPNIGPSILNPTTNAVIVSYVNMETGAVTSSKGKMIPDVNDSRNQAVHWQWTAPDASLLFHEWAPGQQTLDIAPSEKKDLVFRFVVSGQAGSQYEVAFQNSKGQEIRVKPDVNVQDEQQRVLLRLDKLPVFDWTGVRPPQLVATSATGEITVKDLLVLNVKQTREDGVALGMFQDNDFMTPDPNSPKRSLVLSFRDISEIQTHQAADSQAWQQLAAHNIAPYMTLEFKGVPATTAGGTLLQRIAKGDYNTQLRENARAIAQYRRPFLLRLLHEQNGGWYPWSVKSKQDADDYVAAWKNIVNVYRAEGATNASFVFAPHNDSIYPRNDEYYRLLEYTFQGIAPYVNYIGLDGYNYPDAHQGRQDTFNRVFTRLVELFKKYLNNGKIRLFIAETSSEFDANKISQQNGQAMNIRYWQEAGYDLKNGAFPEVEGVTVFDTKKEENNGTKDFRLPADIANGWANDPFFNGHFTFVTGTNPPIRVPMVSLAAASVPVAQPNAFIPEWHADQGTQDQEFVPYYRWTKPSDGRWIGSGVDNIKGGQQVQQNQLKNYAFTLPLKIRDSNSVFNIILEDKTLPGRQIVIASRDLNKFMKDGVLIIPFTTPAPPGFNWSSIKFRFEPTSQKGEVEIGNPEIKNTTSTGAQNTETPIKIIAGRFIPSWHADDQTGTYQSFKQDSKTGLTQWHWKQRPNREWIGCGIDDVEGVGGIPAGQLKNASFKMNLKMIKGEFNLIFEDKSNGKKITISSRESNNKYISADGILTIPFNAITIPSGFDLNNFKFRLEPTSEDGDALTGAPRVGLAQSASLPFGDIDSRALSTGIVEMAPDGSVNVNRQELQTLFDNSSLRVPDTIFEEVIKLIMLHENKEAESLKAGMQPYEAQSEAMMAEAEVLRKINNPELTYAMHFVWEKMNRSVNPAPGENAWGDMNIGYNGKGIPERKTPSVEPDSVASASAGSVNNDLGGIDFRSLTIVTQAMNNLSLRVNNLSINSLRDINLDTEWNGIERLVNSGIVPSAERIKEYLQASCYKGNTGKDIDKVLSCISYILRLEEERCSTTEAELKDLLVVLESVSSTQDLKTLFLGNATI